MKNFTENLEMNISDSDDFKVIAITGGIGSGKSTVAEHYVKLGYPVINTDSLAGKIMRNDSQIKKKLIEVFGEDLYFENGELNNKQFSDLVFGEKNNSNLEKLNKIVHPAVIDEMIEQIEELVESGNTLIFVESALIYESALDEGFDYVIVVDANEEKRVKWASERLKLSGEEIRNRMKEQLSSEHKKNMADFVIENNGTIEELLKNAEFLLDIIKLA